MLEDTEQLMLIRKEWAGVEALQSSLKRDAMVSAAMPMFDGHYPRTLLNASLNLPFLHACSVLNDVLLEFVKQGKFKSSQRTLGALVKDSKSKLQWDNFENIKTVLVEDRNALAHDGVLIDAQTCKGHIEAVKAQLVAWKILA
jgi:hypothetical protein